MDNLREKFEQIIMDYGMSGGSELLEGLKAAYDLALSEQRGWVDVKERLPENRTYCLVYINEDSGYLSTSQYKHGIFWNELQHIQFVTHWMPLPAPPVTNK